MHDPIISSIVAAATFLCADREREHPYSIHNTNIVTGAGGCMKTFQFLTLLLGTHDVPCT